MNKNTKDWIGMIIIGFVIGVVMGLITIGIQIAVGL